MRWFLIASLFGGGRLLDYLCLSLHASLAAAHVELGLHPLNDFSGESDSLLSLCKLHGCLLVLLMKFLLLDHRLGKLLSHLCDLGL